MLCFPTQNLNVLNSVPAQAHALPSASLAGTDAKHAHGKQAPALAPTAGLKHTP